MSLERFLEAQGREAGGYAQALAEIENGHKVSHWIWYIFPQLKGMGYSPMSIRFDLVDVEEACAFLREPRLCDNLLRITSAAVKHLEAGVPLRTLMGSHIDSLKLVSSMTLFEVAAGKVSVAEPEHRAADLLPLCQRVLASAAAQEFPKCQHTLEAVANAG